MIQPKLHLVGVILSTYPGKSLTLGVWGTISDLNIGILETHFDKHLWLKLEACHFGVQSLFPIVSCQSEGKLLHELALKESRMMQLDVGFHSLFSLTWNKNNFVLFQIRVIQVVRASKGFMFSVVSSRQSENK